MKEKNPMRLTVAEAQAVRAEALVFDAPSLPASPTLLWVVGATLTTTARVSVAR
ncbi:MAG TPA: hypothetical protein VGB53_11000 [Rubricoccaceae bacterium]|jgi:hypothetical protein